MADQIQQAMQAIAAAETAAAAQAAPVAAAPPSDPCVAIQGNYIQTQMAFTAASNNYQQCNTSNPSQYPITQSLQPVVPPEQQRAAIAKELNTQWGDIVQSYQNLFAGTQALVLAAQPIHDYRALLQAQLNTTIAENTAMAQQIASDTNTVQQELATIPDLTNLGPFGTATESSGLLFIFIPICILFSILVSIVLYISLKDTWSTSLLLTIIGILLVGTGVGLFFLSIWWPYNAIH